MRKLAWFSSGFAGVCLVCCYGAAGLYRPLLAAFAALAALTLCLRSRLRPVLPARFSGAIRRLLALCLGGAVAAGWFWGWTALFRAPADALVGQTLDLSGVVASYPAETSIGGRSLTVALDVGFASPDVLLYASADWAELRPGDRVTFTARLTDASQLRGDETTYYTAKGIFLLGYCNDPPASVQRPDHLPLRFWPTRCAHALKESLYAAFDAAAAPLCVALVTGDKAGLDEGLSTCLSRAGVAHAVVVSGMHVSCLVGAATFLLQNRRRLAFVALPLLLFYALMAGGSPSALRAVAMQAVLLFAPLARRESDAPTALACALLALLLLNPYAAGSVSLQLSFTSVAGILAAATPLTAPLLHRVSALRKRHIGHRGWALLCGGLNWGVCSLGAGLGAMLFSQPVLALYFQRASLVFPLANLLVLQVVQTLLPAALVTGCLGLFLPGFARALGWLAGWLAHYVVFVVSALGSWRFAAVDTGNVFAALAVAAVYLFLVVCLLAKKQPPRPAVPLVCSAVLLCAAFCFTRLPVASSLLTVAALNVGQGSSTAFFSGGKTCLVDCGGNASESAGDVAADYFAALGLVRLDLLALTHFDADHINGLDRLFARMDVQAVAVPPGAPDELLSLVQAEGAALTYVEEIVEEPLGDATLTLYPPLGGGTSNESGQFILCSAGTFDALVTGDADAFVEKMLVKYYDIPDIELLVAGHHGSKGSTSAELLDALLPELALISVGWNSYGHPSEETLERLYTRNIPVYRTDNLGTVSVYVTQGTEGGYRIRIDAR